MTTACIVCGNEDGFLDEGDAFKCPSCGAVLDKRTAYVGADGEISFVREMWSEPYRGCVFFLDDGTRVRERYFYTYWRRVYVEKER